VPDETASLASSINRRGSAPAPYLKNKIGKPGKGGERQAGAMVRAIWALQDGLLEGEVARKQALAKELVKGCSNALDLVAKECNEKVSQSVSQAPLLGSLPFAISNSVLLLCGVSSPPLHLFLILISRVHLLMLALGAGRWGYVVPTDFSWCQEARLDRGFARKGRNAPPAVARGGVEAVEGSSGQVSAPICLPFPSSCPLPLCRLFGARLCFVPIRATRPTFFQHLPCPQGLPLLSASFDHPFSKYIRLCTPLPCSLL